MIWPRDVQVAYTLWRQSRLNPEATPKCGSPLDCTIDPQPWEYLDKRTQEVLTAMYSAGMQEAASLADGWGDPQLRDEIRHHAQIGEEVMKK